MPHSSVLMVKQIMPPSEGSQHCAGGACLHRHCQHALLLEVGHMQLHAVLPCRTWSCASSRECKKHTRPKIDRWPCAALGYVPCSERAAHQGRDFLSRPEQLAGASLMHRYAMQLLFRPRADSFLQARHCTQAGLHFSAHRPLMSCSSSVQMLHVVQRGSRSRALGATHVLLFACWVTWQHMHVTAGAHRGQHLNIVVQARKIPSARAHLSTPWCAARSPSAVLYTALRLSALAWSSRALGKQAAPAGLQPMNTALWYGSAVSCQLNCLATSSS